MSRRLVAVLFLDLVGWTDLAERLDPEPLQEFLDRYYEVCVTAIKQQDGVVEKFIGDAIMAVFGSERSREDDALRALNAALQASHSVRLLELASGAAYMPNVHGGIAAGEALITSSKHAGVRIVGDVVNLAARLQAAAGPGEILFNEVVARLVRPSMAVAPVAAMSLKGKRDPVRVWRTLDESPGYHPPLTKRPMINRESEQHRLMEAYRNVLRTEGHVALNVTGPAGVGKSRLIDETFRDSAAIAPAPFVVTGVCDSSGLAGGHGPLAQIVDRIMRVPDLSERIASVRDGRALEVLSYIRSPEPGDGPEAGPGAEEICWAVREALQLTARHHLVVVWEDMHEAGPSLADLILELTSGLAHCPMLTLFCARSEYADAISHLSRILAYGRTLDVTPLALSDTIQLISTVTARSDSIETEVVTQSMAAIQDAAERCGGNPLFAELLAEELTLGNSLEAIPPSVTATVGAMVDRLPPESLAVLDRASVIGTGFSLSQVACLGTVASKEAITGLLRRRVISPGSRPDEYCFTQRLVHEVVRNRVDKRQRYRWHLRLAERLTNRGEHLEAAVTLLREVEPDSPDLPTLQLRAADALLHEGTHELRRRDLRAAISRLERATSIATAADRPPAVTATLRLSDALLLTGDAAHASTVVGRSTMSTHDQRADRAFRIQRHLIAVRSGETRGVPISELAAELAHDRDDHVSWCRFQQLRSLMHLGAGEFGAAERVMRAALERRSSS